jgi:hypothetical protein
MYSIVIYPLNNLSSLSEANPDGTERDKGLEIAAKSKVVRKGKSTNLWLVPSQSHKAISWKNTKSLLKMTNRGTARQSAVLLI